MAQLNRWSFFTPSRATTTQKFKSRRVGRNTLQRSLPTIGASATRLIVDARSWRPHCGGSVHSRFWPPAYLSEDVRRIIVERHGCRHHPHAICGTAIENPGERALHQRRERPIRRCRQRTFDDSSWKWNRFLSSDWHRGCLGIPKILASEPTSGVRITTWVPHRQSVSRDPDTVFWRPIALRTRNNS